MSVARSPVPRGRRGLVRLATVLGLGTVGGGALVLTPDPTPAGLTRVEGAPVAMGNGQARTYVVVDGTTGHPTEVGVALSEAALEGLPATSPDHGPGTHGPYSEYLLELPAGNPTPYRFVELDWNPQGHGGPYTAPHFDFHFYRVPVETRNGIDLRVPDFETRAARLPAPEEIPAGYASTHVLLKTTPAGMTVPRMGLHWVDLASPELPPQSKPFTSTFIVGSWDGQVIFDEPMITREFILAHRADTTTTRTFALPAAQRYVPAGFYPASYRIAWDASAREYRIALTELSRRD
jgi:hypothetical protein